MSNIIFDNIRANLTKLTNLLPRLSTAIVNKGGSSISKLSQAPTQISGLFTDGDGLVITEISDDYKPLKVEFRLSSSTTMPSLPDTSKLKSVRIKPTDYLKNNSFSLNESMMTNVTGQRCTTLEEFEWGDCRLTSINSILSGQTKLKSIRMNSYLTSVYGSSPLGPFEGCTSLESINFEDSSITYPNDNTFKDCTSLKSIGFPSGLYYLGNQMFMNCTSLQHVTFNNFSTSYYYSYNRFFYNCPNLELDELPAGQYENFDRTIQTPYNAIGGYAFYGCSKVTFRQLPNFIGQISGGALFETGITEFDTNSLYQMTGPIFCGSQIRKLTINEFIDVMYSRNGYTSFGSYAFNGLAELQELYINALQVWCMGSTGPLISSITVDGKTYPGSENLKKVEYNGSSITMDSTRVINVILTAASDSLLSMKLPPIFEMTSSFSGFTKLRTVSGTIESSGMKFGDETFKDCTDLQTFSQAVCYVGDDCFNGCTSLTSIRFERNSLSPSVSYKIGDNAFKNCSALTTLTGDTSVTSSIGEDAFRGCTSLTGDVSFPSITNISDNAFNGTAITSFTCIANHQSPITISATAFANCSNLTDIYLSCNQGDIANAPWGATNATIHYNCT